MAITENYPVTFQHTADEKVGKTGGLLWLLLFYYGFLPISDIVSGALTTYTTITWFAIAYKAGALLLVLIFLLAGRVNKDFNIFAITITTLLIAGAWVRQSFGQGSAAEDMLYIARGPILLNSMLAVLLGLSVGSVERVARVYFVTTWLATTLSVTITESLGISLASYGGADYGSSGFYQAANEVTLTYVLSWWYIQVRWASSWWKSALLLLVTVYLIYTLGTKSGFAVIPILAMWYVFRWRGLSWFTSLVGFLVAAAIVITFSDSIFLAVLPFLKAADASQFFLETYGVNSTLTGGRFANLDILVATIQSFSITEMIFGIGFSNFWFEAGKSVESDLLDTLGGGGILFAGWFYGILIWGYMCSKTRSLRGRKVDTAWAFVFIAAILYSIFVGHVAFAATPLVTVGMFVGLAYKEHSRENRDPTLLV